MPTNLTYTRIWSVIEKIPKGHVATYGQIAELAGLPRQARLVGYALHAAPDRLKLPWHRVINSRGQISFPPRTRQHREQRRRLIQEGISIENRAVDLAKYRWKPLLQ